MLLAMLAAFAEMERDLIVERTQAGLARARAEGRKLGRPSKTTGTAKAEIVEALDGGATVSTVARQYVISRASVIAIRKEARAGPSSVAPPATAPATFRRRRRRSRRGSAGWGIVEATRARHNRYTANVDWDVQAVSVDAVVFDLKAVNPPTGVTVDERTPAGIITSIDS